MEVVLEGKAEVTSNGARKRFRRLAVKYEDEKEGNRYADYSISVLKDNRLALRFKPEHVLASDFAVEDDDHRPWKTS